MQCLTTSFGNLEGKVKNVSESRRFRSCSILVQIGIMGLTFLLLRGWVAAQSWHGWDLLVLSERCPAVGALKEQFRPGTIWTSEFTLGKDTILVFQDACKPALVNTDDGNYAFGRILAHWDWPFFRWRTEIAGETFILWLNENILNLFMRIWKKLIKPLRARFLKDDKHLAGFRILDKKYGLTWWAVWLEINLRSMAVRHT